MQEILPMVTRFKTLESYFVTGSTREEFGSAPTDASGVATLESGSKITNCRTRFFVGHE
jgi:hypothetical protein